MIPVCVLAAAACGVAPEEGPHELVDLDLEAGGGGDAGYFVNDDPKAHLDLLQSGATLDQHHASGWQLSKSGTVDQDQNTVTWSIVATSTTSSQLVIDGFAKLVNTGGAPAPIGNIVINLQTRHGAGPWITQSSNIADATLGDAATTAHVVEAATSELETTFAENAASGSLRLFDHTSGTEISLPPSYAIPPGATRKLRFFATYDNDVLGISAGEHARAELLVTHGDAGHAGHTAILLDIDGDGQIGPHEHRVQTVSAHHELTVPAPVVTGCSAVTLHDTLADITTTGTVTFSNPTFGLDDTEGTVTVQYDGGTDGGSITNCATLVDVYGEVVAEACDTQLIPDSAGCTPGAPGCGWSDGDFVTYPQDLWDHEPARSILIDNFNAAYAPFGFIVRVGIGFSIVLATPQAVLGYLPTAGPPAALTSNLVDPTDSVSGSFGGEAVVLNLHIVLFDAGFLVGNAGLRFGDLRLCNFDELPGLNGMTVREFLGTVNVLLGGGTAIYAISDIAPVAQNINSSFIDGLATAFAQLHLFSSITCP